MELRKCEVIFLILSLAYIVNAETNEKSITKSSTEALQSIQNNTTNTTAIKKSTNSSQGIITRTKNVTTEKNATALDQNKIINNSTKANNDSSLDVIKSTNSSNFFYSIESSTTQSAENNSSSTESSQNNTTEVRVFMFDDNIHGNNITQLPKIDTEVNDLNNVSNPVEDSLAPLEPKKKYKPNDSVDTQITYFNDGVNATDGIRRKSEQDHIESIGLVPGKLAAILAGIFLVVSIIGYLILMSWRRYLENRYGNREMLVDEDFCEKMNDLEHFSFSTLSDYPYDESILPQQMSTIRDRTLYEES